MVTKVPTPKPYMKLSLHKTMYIYVHTFDTPSHPEPCHPSCISCHLLEVLVGPYVSILGMGAKANP